MKGLKLNYFKMSKYNTEIDILYGKKKFEIFFFLDFFSDFFFKPLERFSARYGAEVKKTKKMRLSLSFSKLCSDFLGHFRNKSYERFNKPTHLLFS